MTILFRDLLTFTNFTDGAEVGTSAGMGAKEDPMNVTTNGKNEEKPWRNHMKKSISVESQPSA